MPRVLVTTLQDELLTDVHVAPEELGQVVASYAVIENTCRVPSRCRENTCRVPSRCREIMTPRAGEPVWLTTAGSYCVTAREPVIGVRMIRLGGGT